MSNPLPLSLLHILSDGVQLCSVPQIGVGYLVGPSDVQDVSLASVDDSLQFVSDGDGHSLISIQEHCLYIGIMYGRAGVRPEMRGS